MSKATIYVLDPYHAEAIARLQSIDTVTSVLNDDSRLANWKEEADAVLIRSETKLGYPQFSQCKKLKAVVKMSPSHRLTLYM
jgi:D-3-phosphoglycerate dehydrogenase / 2-oxoglutarate reductase